MANQNQNRNQSTAVAVAPTPSPAISVAAAKELEKKSRDERVKEDAIRSRMVEIPMKPAEGYAGRSMHFDLSGKQAETLKQITAALLAQEAKLVDGRRVSNGRMTIEWILEQVARS